MIKAKIKTVALAFVLVVALIISFVFADISYYNPSSTIIGDWNRGTGTTHSEITDTARQPSTPNTGSFVASRLGDGHTSEFRLQNIIEEVVENITLWVYAETGNTAEFTFSLRQGSNVVCSTLVPGSTSSSWRSCTWTNPSGNLSDLRLHLSTVERAAGGGPANAIVYAAYIAIEKGPNPPNVTLISPFNDNILTGSAANFTFIVQDELYSNLTCFLYGNFSGSWSSFGSLSNVINNTVATFSVSPSDNYYSWNVMCENDFGRQGFDEHNRTVFVNLVPPNFANSQLNETVIRPNRSVLFNVNITDSFGIDSATFTIRYPNNSEEEFSLNNSGDTFYYVITNTTNLGTYIIIDVWANDTLGQENNFDPELSFLVQAVAPDEFNLLYPVNKTESQTLTPTMGWEETNTPDFKNYTLQISKYEDFNILEQTHYSTNISISEIEIDELDEDAVYYWRVIAYDIFGNQRVSNQVFTYITDNTPPLITLNIPANNAYSTRTLNNFTFTPQDANTLDYCSLYTNSSGSWTLVNETSSPINNSQNILSAEGVEGYNSWNVECFDLAGNGAFSEENFTLIIDLTPPIIQIINPVNNSIIDTTNIINFEINASDAYSEIQSCSLVINETIYQTENNIINNEVYVFEQFLVNDYYSWRVTCVDANGWESSSETLFFSIISADNDPPVITRNFPPNNFYSSANTMIFNYTVQDATGIDNCSIIVNDVIEQTAFGVETFINNFFTVLGIGEGENTWAIECFDNSTQHNYAITNNRTLFVDLTNPIIVLNSPEDESFLNYSAVNFEFFPEDENLDYCALYTNISGVFEESQRNNNPISETQNNFTLSLPDGSFIWNVLCVDLSARYSFGDNNRSVMIDTTPPKYSDIALGPESPTVYSDVQTYEFNITWTDNFAVDTVLFEHNFSGSQINETVEGLNNVYSFSVQGINTGQYSYRWHANDTLNNKNKTNTYFFVVNKDNATLNLYLNSSEDNLTINEGEFVNITGVITKPDSGNITLLINDEVIVEGSGVIADISLFEIPGYYNITLKFDATNNYNFAQKSLLLKVLDTTPPSISLISPDNNSIVSSGITVLQYSVSDFSDVLNCSLYINNTLNQTSNSVVKDETQTFIVDFSEDNYSWRVQCFDSYNNEGISKTRFFTAIQADVINVLLQTDKSEYEEGEPIFVNVTTQDFFENILITSVETSIIDIETSIPWWNSSWHKRKQIFLNETRGEDIVSGLGRINVTDLGGIISSCNELRIIHHDYAEVSEVPLHIYSGSDDWCLVGFELNVTANSENYSKYYVYYNNSNSEPSDFVFNIITETNFYAQQSGIDAGTPTNIENIIGFNDNTFATMNQGGGGGTHSGHGRAFISNIPGEDIEKVEVRYRYETSLSSGTWSLRYSTNNGTSYSSAQSGASSIAKTTSSWFDITNVYSSLSWFNLNNTRLQGHVTKTGGGSITMNLFWVEMRITHTRFPDTIQITAGVEENLVAHQSNSTDLNGEVSFIFSNLSLYTGNYSIISLAKESGFSNAKNMTLIRIIPDVTPPVVVLLSPENNSKLDKGYHNFSYSVFDYNLNNCTLYLGNDELIQNVTSNNPVNEENIFENIYLTYNDYIWNVECVDVRGNKAFADSNFTFEIIVPDPEAEVSIDENNIIISWPENSEVDYYNLYETDNYSNFPQEPTMTELTLNQIIEDISLFDNKFYKIKSIIGNRESEGVRVGIYRQFLNEGFNLLSMPFYLSDYELKDSENDGLRFSTSSDCLRSIWRFDSDTKTFEKTDWEGGTFIPSTGSENFQELSRNEGYFFETDDVCTLKIAGIVPQNIITKELYEDLNLISWMGAEEQILPTNYAPRLLVTNPEDSIHTINRFNSTTQRFEITTYLKEDGIPWGWWPSSNNMHFTKLRPLEGYYFVSSSVASLTYTP